jgi:hypothetical protein
MPDDIILLVSDGVHDNFDPQHLGKSPTDLNVKSDSWEEAEKKLPAEAEEAKNSFRKNLLKDMIMEIVKEGNPVEPRLINKKLLDYCWTITDTSRKFMVENPTKKLPFDFVQFPGKMDHATIVSLKIGGISPNLLQSSSGNNINSN